HGVPLVWGHRTRLRAIPSVNSSFSAAFRPTRIGAPSADTKRRNGRGECCLAVRDVPGEGLALPEDRAGGSQSSRSTAVSSDFVVSNSRVAVFTRGRISRSAVINFRCFLK